MVGVSRLASALRQALGRLLRLAVWAAATLLILVGLLLVLAWILPLPERLQSSPSVVVEFADGSPAHVFLSPDQKWRIRVRLGEVDPAYLRALLLLEDRRFLFHAGVDPWAILRAAALNLIHGRVVSGGSTITMQLCRLLEPRPRTLWSKVLEAFRALQLELRMDKRRILEAYLQFLPFGGNVEGVQAAALSTFGHTAASLSLEEIATLLAIPQDPAHRAPRPTNAARLKTFRDRIAAKLLSQGLLDDAAGAESPWRALGKVQAAAVPSQSTPFPRHAIHAAMWLRALSRGELRIRTTLDRGAQIQAERVMAMARIDLEGRGIHNGAVVVVDTRRAEVRALIGNFDFWDRQHAGQVVGFAQPRSVGSALKPLVYALSLDRGNMLPGFLVPDTPVQYGTYAPKNYDEHYSGLVRIEDALSQSLNVPFVNLLQQLGVETFLGTLRGMGVQSLNPDPGHYGLSAVIGGIEVSPLELAGIFATLANHGEYRPLRWRIDQESARSRIFSNGAAYLTRQALSRKDRPDFPSRLKVTGIPSRIHWKTGTSYGHRDAWAAGSGPSTTAVVWLGNFDNTPSRDLIGAEAAGPLLFDLLEASGDRQRGLPPEAVPGELTPIRVCAYSGFPAGPDCPASREVLALRRHVPTVGCPFHLSLDVDEKTGQALTPACRAGHHYRRQVFLTWPASIRRWLQGEHLALPEAPAFAPECVQGGALSPPTITNPPAGQIAFLIPGLAADRQEIPLEAESRDLSGRLSWFVDGEFLGRFPAENRVWWTPRPGLHDIVVTDQNGLSDRRSLEVRQAK